MNLPLSYNWHNLLARKLSTSLTFLVVAVVVFVLTLLLSFASGIRASLKATGWPQNVIVLKPGATAESTSLLNADEITLLTQIPGVERLRESRDGVPTGTLLISPELCVQTNLPRRGRGAIANVAVRGVDPVGFVVHPEVRIIEGRNFEQGALEVIVGSAARERFDGLSIGDEIQLGRKGVRSFRIVGVFATGGSALESELWTPRTMLNDAYQHRFVSGACVRLANASAVPAAVAYVESPAVGLTGRAEPRYYDELARTTRDIVVLTSILIAIMGVGAAFAVANTLYTAVDNRRREIAMLRTLGFSRSAVLIAFVVESLLLCMTACAAGLLASLSLNGSRQDFLSDSTWTVLAYQLRVTPSIMAIAFATALVVALVGAVAPAVRAARTDVLRAMRRG